MYLTWINDYLHPEDQKKTSYPTYIKVTHKEVNKSYPALIQFSSIHLVWTKFSKHMIKFCLTMIKQRMDFLGPILDLCNLYKLWFLHWISKPVHLGFLTIYNVCFTGQSWEFRYKFNSSINLNAHLPKDDKGNHHLSEQITHQIIEDTPLNLVLVNWPHKTHYIRGHPNYSTKVTGPKTDHSWRKLACNGSYAAFISIIGFYFK